MFFSLFAKPPAGPAGRLKDESNVKKEKGLLFSYPFLKPEEPLYYFFVGGGG